MKAGNEYYFVTYNWLINGLPSDYSVEAAAPW